MEPKSPAVDEDRDPLGIFGKYLTVWVALAGGLGVCIGHFAPEVTDALDEVTIKQISMPVTVLIWLMVYPMVIKIDMTSIKAVRLVYLLCVSSCFVYAVFVQSTLCVKWTLTFFAVNP